MAKNLTEKSISLDDAAKSCGIGRSRFSSIFSETMGISFSRFALRSRVSMAAQMLRTSKAPVKEIAEKYGFLELSHFYHVFKNHFNCSPAHYRGVEATTEPK